MIAAQFDYHVAADPREAVDALDRLDGQILAGGQTLLPRIKNGLEFPRTLVDVRLLSGLDSIGIGPQVVSIGATTRQRTLEDSDELAARLPIIREAAMEVADPAVRSQGTIVGSMAAADPTGDWPAVALALNGVVTAIGPDSERGVPVHDLLLGPFSTSLERNELITRLQLEIPPSPSGMAYLKLRHPASGYALVGVAAVLWLDANGRCGGCRVAVTGAGPKAARLRSTEHLLEGMELDSASITQAASHATDGFELTSDIHASEAYRAELVKVYVRRAVSVAATRAHKAASS